MKNRFLIFVFLLFNCFFVFSQIKTDRPVQFSVTTTNEYAHDPLNIYKDENGIIKCRRDLPNGFIGEVDGVRYTVVDNLTFRRLMENFEGYMAPDPDLRFICTSKVRYMNNVHSKFYGYLSNWDVSNVIDMDGMFEDSAFNGDISKWDVSNVKSMMFMFEDSAFNGDISKWDVSNVTNMRRMFMKSAFNGDISNWDVSNVIDMEKMFIGEDGLYPYTNPFNGNIYRWDVSSVTDMSQMFRHSAFNRDISKWDVSNVKSMMFMFENSAFNGDISNWDVSNVIDDKYGILFKFSKIPEGNKPKYNYSY